MILSSKYDNSLLLILKNDKKNRKEIVDLVKAIPAQYYNYIQQLIENGEEQKIFFTHHNKENDLHYLIQYNGDEYNSVSISELEDTFKDYKKRRQLDISDDIKSPGRYIIYYQKEEYLPQNIINFYTTKSSKINNDKYRVFSKEIISASAYKKKTNLTSVEEAKKLSLDYLDNKYN